MINIKKILLTIFSATALITFIILPVEASSLIEEQQQRLKAIEPTWVKQNIPSGMPTAESLGSVRASNTRGVSMLARNIDFYFTDGIGFHVENLTASFEPLNPKQPVNLDDPRQFIIHVHTGTVVVPPDSLSNVFNKQVLDYWPRPLNNMKISTTHDALIAKSGLRLWNWLPPIGWVPSYLKGQVVLNRDDKLVYTPYDIRALGIPICGVLKTFGIKLSSLITLNRQGANLEGNSLILDHTKLFPPPALEGNITAISLDDAGLHLTFGDKIIPKFSPPASASNSFIWIQSGDIKLFDVVVLNANVLIKKDNNSVLLFNLYDYRNEIGKKNVLTMAEDGSMILTLSS